MAWRLLFILIKNNLGIIGVVILAIIVLIIASITYAYVESIRIKPDEEINTFIVGKILSISRNSTIEFKDEEFLLFNVEIQNKSNITKSYSMFFYQLYPPLDGLDFKLYYDIVNIESSTFYRIVRVELI